MKDRETRGAPRRVGVLGLISLLVGVLYAPGALADGDRRLGGHVGAVLPWVTLDEDGGSEELWETFAMGVPMGITVKDVFGPVAFDLEIVPSINERHEVDVTIHPGLIYPTKIGAFGVRAAFVVDGDSVGFTPLFARPILQLSENSSLFLELDIPVRFPDEGDTTIGFASHIGISF